MSTFTKGGQSIDLVLVSTPLREKCRVVVHNGIHCVSNGCNREWCREVARSDHFLVELSIERHGGENHERLSTTSRPRMPAGFPEASAWQEVLQPLLPLAQLLAELLSPCEEDWHVRCKDRRHRQREADIIASCVEMSFLLGIVIWCSCPDSGLTEQRPAEKPLGPDEWQKRWIGKAAESMTKGAALTSLCRAVTPLAPRPPWCMTIAGSKASAAESHEGWRKRLVAEKLWETNPTEAVMDHIFRQENALLEEARSESLMDGFDVSFEQVQKALRQWDNSLGLPSWIPRAALRTKIAEVERLIWVVVAKAVRLLVRPRSWAVSKQVAFFKRGDLDIFTSWRNIMISTQLGLLMERLFWGAVVDDIRKALGPCQTGYVHRCETSCIVFS